MNLLVLRSKQGTATAWGESQPNTLIGMFPTFAMPLPVDQKGKPLWLLTLPELRHTSRVRVFMDHIAAALRAKLTQT